MGIEESRWNEIQRPLCVYDQNSSVLPCQSDYSLMQTHSGKTERHSGRTVQEKTISDRMDSLRACVSGNHENFSRIGSGLVCDSFQQQTTSVCLSLPRQHSSDRRRSECRLDSQRSLCFSPPNLIPVVLRKLDHQVCKITLISTLNWNRAWTSELLRRALQPPLSLPLRRDILFQPGSRQLYPGSRNLDSSCVTAISLALRDKGFLKLSLTGFC